MLNPTEEIRECYRRAVEPQVRQQLLELKQRWLLLARRYEFNGTAN
jgi:hypothetical protein